MGTILLTAAPNISLPLPFTHTCVETQVSVKEEKAWPTVMTAPAGESKRLHFQEKSNGGEHPFSLEQVVNTFSVWADPILLLKSKNSNSSPVIACTTDQRLSLLLSVASSG